MDGTKSKTTCKRHKTDKRQTERMAWQQAYGHIVYGHKKQRRTPKGSDKRKMLQWIEAHNWNMDRRAATERNWWTQNQL